MDASGSEEKGKGQATMKVTSTMASSGSGTRVKVVQDIQLSGAAAQFDRGMVQDVTSVLMKSFAKCIADDIGRSSRGEASVKRDAVSSEGFQHRHAGGDDCAETVLRAAFRPGKS